MSTKQRVPVFVISLARAKERRESICKHLSNLNIDYQMIDAIDGTAFSNEEVNSIVAKNVSLHPGALGCYLSHVEAYRIVVQNKYPVALILEDDARLNPKIKNLLNEGLSFMNWHYCFLDSDDHNDKGPIFYDLDSKQNLGFGFSSYLLSEGPQTLHAYFITYEGASKRLEHAYPLVKPIDLYDHLPYKITFFSIISPKAAWVSEYSLSSMTSTKSTNLNNLSFLILRRWPVFYQLRDILTLKSFKKANLINELQKKGILAPNKQWKPLPSGREVILD